MMAMQVYQKGYSVLDEMCSALNLPILKALGQMEKGLDGTQDRKM